jgi:Ca-activated chloride channel family protein
MKRTTITIFFIVLIIGALGLTLFTRAKKVNAEVAAGNLAYAAQDFETALQHYSTAQSQAPGQPEPFYNAANAYFQQQALDQAQQSLEKALAQPQKTIEAFIRFNLGNVAYLAKQFEAAIAQYETVLRFDPADQAAKYNLELALLQQQEQQNQQQQDQQQQDQQDQQQDGQDQQDQQQDQQGQQQDQQGQQDQQDQQGQQDQQEQQQNGQNQQDQQQDQQGQQDQQAQQQNQQGQRTRANQRGQLAAAGTAGRPAHGQVAGAQPQQGLTPEQARQLLAAIARDSKSLLQQLQMYYYIPGIDPEKDW